MMQTSSMPLLASVSFASQSLPRAHFVPNPMSPAPVQVGALIVHGSVKSSLFFANHAPVPLL